MKKKWCTSLFLGKTSNAYLTEKNKTEPFYIIINEEKLQISITYYDDIKMAVYSLIESTNIMIIEWYENNQLVNTATLDLNPLELNESGN